MHLNLSLSKRLNTAILAGIRVLTTKSAWGTVLWRWDTQSGLHLGEGQRMILSGPTWIWLKGPFCDSTLRGSDKLGDNNQVAVELVFLKKALSFEAREAHRY